MTNEIQIPWIQKGYQIFAYEGPNGLRVERLSREIGKNKSSFYHHFADLEIFTGILLRHHLDQVKVVADKEAHCGSLKDLVDVLTEHKVDLLFSRQLRIHRENAEFKACFVKTNEITVPAIIRVWSDIIELKDNSHLAGLVLQLSIENFFLQITDETLNRSWLHNYFDSIRILVKQFKKTSATEATLNGGV